MMFLFLIFCREMENNSILSKCCFKYCSAITNTDNAKNIFPKTQQCQNTKYYASITSQLTQPEPSSLPHQPKKRPTKILLNLTDRVAVVIEHDVPCLAILVKYTAHFDRADTLPVYLLKQLHPFVDEIGSDWHLLIVVHDGAVMVLTP
jgi:hypothetical protein